MFLHAPRDGFSLPIAVTASDNSHHDAPELETLAQSSYLLLLEHVNLEIYHQQSPLSHHAAHESVTMLAHLHSWAWEDADKLTAMRGAGLYNRGESTLAVAVLFTWSPLRCQCLAQFVALFVCIRCVGN